MKSIQRILGAAVAAALSITSLARAEEAKPAAYPLDKCVFSGKELGSMGDPVTIVHEGREIKVCCANCETAFKADPAAGIKKVDDAIIAAQKADYPLTTCVISGKELGSMGDPIDIVVANTLVRVCCKGCTKGVTGNPAKAIEKINAAIIEKQGKDYPLTDCPVSGHKLGEMGDIINVVHKGTLIKLCCDGCNKGVAKDGDAIVAKIKEARAKAAK